MILIYRSKIKRSQPAAAPTKAAIFSGSEKIRRMTFFVCYLPLLPLP
ncbi:hypothetical protein PG5_19740 [Pseudomonas sp. G5(2012)]|nr:hypothetical protein PG5_19740 [Pseudomonas sp. G5(2012)]